MLVTNDRYNSSQLRYLILHFKGSNFIGGSGYSDIYYAEYYGKGAGGMVSCGKITLKKGGKGLKMLLFGL